MDTINFEIVNQVGWVRLARPNKHNPFDAELRTELMTVLEQVRQDPEIRVLVLTGSHGVFCAGGNLQVLHEHLDSGAQYWQQRLKTGLRFTQDMLNLGKPVIAINTATYWHALRAVGLTDRLDGFGTLLSHH